MNFYQQGLIGATPASFELPVGLPDGVWLRLTIVTASRSLSFFGTKQMILVEYQNALNGVYGEFKDALVHSQDGSKFYWQASQHPAGEPKKLLGPWAMAGIGLTLVVLFLGGGRRG